MKRLLVPLIVLLVLAFVITGCGTSTPSATTNPVQTTSVPTTTASTTVPISVPETTTTQTTTSAPTTVSSPTTASSPEPQYGGTLIRLSSMSPGSPFYPPEAVFLSVSDMAPCLEGLVFMDCKGNATPKLATAWEVAPDKKSITITLRKGVKFHDETDFNAAAAKWAMDEYIAAKRAPAWQSVDIIDNYTIRLNLKYWENTAIQDLDVPIFTSPTAFQKNGLKWAEYNPVGTGPFKFVSYEPNVSLKFTKFNDYWNKGLPYLDGVEWNYIADKMTMTAAFKAGQGHLMRMGTLQAVAQLRDQGYQVLTALVTGAKQTPNVLMPDSKNPDSPFAKLEVREAVEYAIDKAAIAKARGFGFWVPAYQLAALNSTDFAPNLPERTYDPAKAKQLLSDAGYPNGFKCTLIVQPGLQDRDAAVAIQGYLQDVGIDAQLEVPDMGKFVSYTQNGWHDALLMTGIGYTPNFAGSMKYDVSQYNTTSVSVAIPDDYANAIDAALQTLTPEPEKEQAVSKAAYDNEIVIPLEYIFEGAPVQPGVHNPGDGGTGITLFTTPDVTWLEPSARIK